ncbi:Hypothetical predicted protein [Olea europaea subsp. europaea]|uniref:Uncharacterized protein n=1 Tax=Olea europaea subsp. europaea TaxID=158383 RepID=A0A8S0VEN3_OLEEU|nr:Hypothetical predicted protein [Olea europaea subsp. europaea]
MDSRDEPVQGFLINFSQRAIWQEITYEKPFIEINIEDMDTLRRYVGWVLRLQMWQYKKQPESRKRENRMEEKEESDKEIEKALEAKKILGIVIREELQVVEVEQETPQAIAVIDDQSVEMKKSSTGDYRDLETGVHIYGQRSGRVDVGHEVGETMVEVKLGGQSTI